MTLKNQSQMPDHTYPRALAERLIRRHEGVRHKPYQDSVGKLTIGVGRNLTDRGLTPQEVNALFETDMRLAEQILTIWFEGWRDLSPSRQAALLSMAFNLGGPRLTGFVKLRRALGQQDFETAAKEALNSRWAKQVGKRATHIAALLSGQEILNW